jgi:prepilin-type N-terminal cleavage/methylation domain-containing protein
MKRLRERLAKRLGRAHRGMTLLEIMIVLAILALVMGLVVGPRVMRLFGQSKVKIAWITANKMANEAFGDWAQSHPSKSCPDSIEELAKNMNSEDTKDPWGHPYKMYCGQTVPPGAKGGVAIQSAGENGKFDDADDIKSWEKNPDE